ncbi:MAG TPA: FG-GAP-like repeat-containing protein [Blastocatellia bacterium]|nr:FG-GAP-like repeat-containing protein [Blastocatellia bacterium]HMV84041.1 FG-GAP-like repeat-containing protein [Blastocatellia bacterium]HMY73708.1 FG-GAP-like repeat-containing protein [Blastocatellia bacterium]HNG33748.1 FG-GAP-like repeat-containing protein [Blastocatellia bacterium]
MKSAPSSLTVGQASACPHREQTKVRSTLFAFFLCIGLLLTARQLRTVSAEQNAACGTAGTRFQAAENFFDGTDTRAAATGDFNRDGLPDLAVLRRVRNGSNELVVLAGNGRAQFATVFQRSFRLADVSPFNALAVADFNGDGRPDLAAAVDATPVLLGRGDGTFTAAAALPGNFTFASVAAADFNTDGKMDFAAVTFSGESRLMTGNGDGTFAQGAPITTGSFSSTNSAITAVELNNDGKPDLFICFGSTARAYLNNGAGGFTAAGQVQIANSLNGFALGDFNGDGNRDLVLSSFVDPYRLYLGDGRGAFGAPASLPSGGGALTVADLNKDGRPDLIGAGSGSIGTKSGSVVVLLNSAGGFTARNTYLAGRAVSMAVVADFNLDGQPDVIAANQDTDSFPVFPTLTFLAGDGTGRLLSGLQIPESAGISEITVADLNQDNRPDVILTGSQSFSSNNGVQVALRNAQGGFETAQRYLPQGFSQNYLDAVAADFNNDNLPDIAALASSGFQTNGFVTIFPGTGNGRFNQERSRNFNLGNSPVELVAADFNRDGFVDLAMANSSSNDLSVALNDGRGGFLAEIRLPAGLDPQSLLVADLNADGNPDLAVANRNSATVSLFFGDGRGGFLHVPLGVNGNPRAIFAADASGDGKLDLIVPLSNVAAVSVLPGMGAGNFGSPMMTALSVTPLEAAAADFNADGKIDLAVTANGRVNLFAGDGAGKFNAAESFALPDANELTTVDFNTDGMPDLAVRGTNSVWIVTNGCAPPPPALVNLSAANFAGVVLSPEMIVAAFGNGFTSQAVSATTLPLPTQLGGASVSVKDQAGTTRAAPLFFAGPNQVNYLMPAGTAAGAATVTVTAADGKTSTETVVIAPASPSFFSANANGAGVAAGYVLHVRANGQQSVEPIARLDATTGQFVPVPISLVFNDQYFLVLFGTGIRPTAGSTVTATVGGRAVPVQYAGPQGSPGLDQVNLSITNIFGQDRTAAVVLTVDGRVAGNVFVTF